MKCCGGCGRVVGWVWPCSGVWWMGLDQFTGSVVGMWEERGVKGREVIFSVEEAGW